MENKLKITEEDPEINVLHLLNEYADSNPYYKNSFLDSCDKVFRERGYLSPAQIHTLNAIYEKLGL